MAICRIDPEKKQPVHSGWSTRSLEPDDIGRDDHLGILTGALSNCRRKGHSLVGVDLDAPEAVRLADQYLPATKMVEGRPGKPLSHWYFLVPNESIPLEDYSTATQAAAAAVEFAGHPGPRTRQFRDPQRREILRLLGTGGQLVCPPSLHPSGERRSWDGPMDRPGRPAVVPYGDLRAAAEGLALACGYTPLPGHTAGAAVTTGAAKVLKLDHWLEHRIEKYLDACPPAVSGRNGHGQLFSVAVALVHGFALAPEAALAVLMAEYNPRCRPMWTVAELRHKVEDAARVPHDKPRGYLANPAREAEPLPQTTPGTIRRAYETVVRSKLARRAGFNQRGTKA